MYLKYNYWSCICILHFCKSEILFFKIPFKLSCVTCSSAHITVKRLFRRLNAAVPSAPVERLISKGALITTRRRNRLSDEHFQKLLILNANKQ